jgi:hypothetical protein
MIEALLLKETGCEDQKHYEPAIGDLQNPGCCDQCQAPFVLKTQKLSTRECGTLQRFVPAANIGIDAIARAESKPKIPRSVKSSLSASSFCCFGVNTAFFPSGTLTSPFGDFGSAMAFWNFDAKRHLGRTDSQSYASGLAGGESDFCGGRGRFERRS